MPVTRAMSEGMKPKVGVGTPTPKAERKSAKVKLPSRASAGVAVSTPSFATTSPNPSTTSTVTRRNVKINTKIKPKESYPGKQLTLFDSASTSTDSDVNFGADNFKASPKPQPPTGTPPPPKDNGKVVVGEEKVLEKEEQSVANVEGPEFSVSPGVKIPKVKVKEEQGGRSLLPQGQNKNQSDLTGVDPSAFAGQCRTVSGLLEVACQKFDANENVVNKKAESILSNLEEKIQKLREQREKEAEGIK